MSKKTGGAAATALMMRYGYNGFSYRDLSALVHIKTSSIHYYFPSKTNLALEAVSNYGDVIIDAVRCIAPDASALRKIGEYIQVFSSFPSTHRVCLCGMLAAEFEALPDPVKRAIRYFFKFNEDWIERVLIQGISEGTIDGTDGTQTVARTFFSSLQGSLLASRLFDDPSRIMDLGMTLANLLRNRSRSDGLDTR